MNAKFFRWTPLVLLLALSGWYLFKESSTTDAPFIQIANQILPKTRNLSSTAAGSTSTLQGKLHEAAILVGRLDESPEKTELDLQTWAQSMSENDIQELKNFALDLKQPQDDRFLAVMLIGWSQKELASELLKGIALSEIDSFLSPQRQGDFERILRMQAVDGILNTQNQQAESVLKTIASQTSETLIADRAQRALWASRGKAELPAVQDQRAFEKLLTPKEAN